MRFEPRQYQADTVEAWYPDILKEGIHPVVALPTGSGKSVILGLLIEKYLAEFPVNEILILSHTEEIVKQDYDALKEFFPDDEIGIWSAGLGTKVKEQITIGGIQSVIRSPDKFKWTNLVIVDECHSVNHKSEGNYRKLFKEMHATIAGMSATVYRSGHGYIYEGAGTLFNELSYDLTSTVAFNKLEKDGYICKLISVAPSTQLDSSKVKKTAGDYNAKALSKAHDKEEITEAAVQNALYYGKNYSKWLVFAIDIEHAIHIDAVLRSHGITSCVLHSRMDSDRADLISDFRAGKYRAMVSVGMVTTGFDVQDIDLILMLRPTMSAVLHVQMIGRGLRVHPSKKHCLVLDYAGNTTRLGPINAVTIPKKKGEGGGGEAPAKTCPKCSTITYAVAKFCESCGHEFKFEIKLTTVTDASEVVSRSTTKTEKVQWYRVDKVSYNLHHKAGAPTSLKVTYVCGVKTFNEYICPDHQGYAKRKALHWAKFRGYSRGPGVFELFKHSTKLKQPDSILVDTGGKYPQIQNSKFEGAK